jgi:hypothetical protein
VVHDERQPSIAQPLAEARRRRIVVVLKDHAGL